MSDDRECQRDCPTRSACYSTVLDVLDELALMLTEHHHIWTDQQRTDYEMAADMLLEGIDGNPVRANYQTPRMDRQDAKYKQLRKLYDLRGKALLRPCPKCGHAPKTIHPQEMEETRED